VHARRLAAAGTLDVDDAVDAWRNVTNRHMPAGLANVDSPWIDA